MGCTLAELTAELELHACIPHAFPSVRQLYKHQEQAIQSVLADHRSTVIATGTGSGKTEAFLVPVVELCLRHPGSGVKAIIVYPMNALAEDQIQRIQNCLGGTGLRVAQYTGEQTSALRRQRDRLLNNPPDILVTNHIMLERILTREKTHSLRGQGTLQVLVFDEVHVFRGNVGADIAWLIRRVRAASGMTPICIGASATLQSSGGYLADAPGEEPGDDLQQFLRQLFSPPVGSPVRLIQPVYQDEPVAGGDLPEPDWEGLGWSADLQGDGQAGVKALLGPTFDGTAHRTDVFSTKALDDDSVSRHQELAGHAVVRAWRKYLIEHGAVTYAELVAVAGTTYQQMQERACPDAELLTQGCLTAIQRVNFEAAQASKGVVVMSPALNLVTHVVLRNVRGKASVCLPCNRYHIGAEDACLKCGRPLLDVWREDVNWAVALVPYPDHLLLPLPSDNDAENRLLVRIARADRIASPPLSAFRVDLPDDRSTEGITFLQDANGAWLMDQVPVPLPLRRAELTVTPLETRHNLEYLVILAQALLRVAGSEPRLLVFADARERVAVAGYVLAESMAEPFLRGLAAECLPDDSGSVTLEAVRDHIQAEAVSWPDDPYYNALRTALDLWFVRLCATAPRLFPEHGRVLQVAAAVSAMGLGTPAQFLIETCLREGAILWAEIVPLELARSRIFEFDHRLRTMQRVVTFDPGATPRHEVQSVALTGGANSRYACEVGEFGTEALRHCAEALVAGGILRHVLGAYEQDFRAYALSLSAVALVVNSNGSGAGPDFQAVGIHNSETPQDERRRLEADFKAAGGVLHTLVVTSTLEMGVDIGNLRHVLCHGMPPSPANYAQRVGRAGRSNAAWYALGAVWCDDLRQHDMFFFHRPDETRLMLSGQVVAPSMDADNPHIVRRHLFAAAVQDRVDDPLELARLIEQPERCRDWIPATLLQQFQARLDVSEQLRDVLAPGLRLLLQSRGEAGRESRGIGETWFNSKLPPDYGFHHDEVTLKLPDTGGENWHPWQKDEEVVSQRLPEEAVRLWAPGGVAATPRGYMRITEGIKDAERLFPVLWFRW